MSFIRTAIDRLDDAGEHGAAVHLLQSVMERSPGAAWPIYRLAAIHEARGENATAADLYRRGAALTPTDPALAGKLGELAIAEKDFPEAVRAYEHALELDAGDDRHRLLYGLGKALDRMGEQRNASRRLHPGRHGRSDAAAPPGGDAGERTPLVRAALHDRAIRSREHRRRPRAHEHDPEDAVAPPGPLQVFSYWAQGEQAAPPLVKMCLSELRKMNPDADVHVLDQDSFRYFVSIPEATTRRLARNQTHFSDILRVSLLARYGGVWSDARPAW